MNQGLLQTWIGKRVVIDFMFPFGVTKGLYSYKAQLNAVEGTWAFLTEVEETQPDDTGFPTGGPLDTHEGGDRWVNLCSPLIFEITLAGQPRKV